MEAAGRRGGSGLGRKLWDRTCSVWTYILVLLLKRYKIICVHYIEFIWLMCIFIMFSNICRHYVKWCKAMGSEEIQGLMEKSTYLIKP